MISKEARSLNKTIKQTPFFDLLSKKGKAIYFPKTGFVQQSLDAKGKKIDATAGIANEDSGEIMHLPLMAKMMAIKPNNSFSYSPSSGNPELRQLWKEEMIKKNPSLRQEISSPVVTAGITHGIYLAAYLFAEKGVDIIMPDLYWENYKLIFENGFGARIKTFQMFKDSRFNIEGLDEAIKGSKRPVVLLNFPNNPTGYTLTVEESKAVSDVIGNNAKQRPIAVICDDAYFGLVYREGIDRESIFPKLIEKDNVLAIKCDGATKENFAWGLRIGFITFGMKNGTREFYEALEKKAVGAIRGSISSSCTLSQSLIAECLKGNSYMMEKQAKFNLLKERFEEIEKAIKEEKYRKYLEPLPFNSGYFMCMNLKSVDAEKLRKRLLQKYDTGIIAVGGKIRIAYSAIPKEKIREIFNNIYSACEEISGQK
ncbi:MAG: aminotransferase class I/II-fold pyridoxal phosphate-dependent enzyme [Candidatus Micrarchaeota archaeon]|nr:aminotransferase class I/II-fold pyridoxal phosphate-dependent enzyme [Candidatus Micrarchaeota archaeon]